MSPYDVLYLYVIYSVLYLVLTPFFLCMFCVCTHTSAFSCRLQWLVFLQEVPIESLERGTSFCILNICNMNSLKINL